MHNIIFIIQKSQNEFQDIAISL